jgi:hypothetical protein
LSFSIFLTEKARESVTAKGSPSGMATTTTVIANIKYESIYVKSAPVFHDLDNPFYMPNLTSITIIIKMAE